MTLSPAHGGQLRLEIIDLHKQEDVEDLVIQRKICGWNYTLDVIEKWRSAADKGLKTMFWIILPEQDNAKAGHISLASKAEPPHPDLAKEDRSVMTISNFFILPVHRSGGIGRKVMDLMEDMATKEPYGSPRCKAIAIDTFSDQYYDPSHPMYAKFKDYTDKQPSNQQWYQRRGYTPFKVEPRYQEGSAGDVYLNAVFLRKEL